MTILIFFLILFVLILVHEFGHFATAKWFGIRVDEFGIGFPPKLFGKKFGETEYTFNWLPIGGFVRIFGENPDEENTEGPDRARSFVYKPKWQQAIVLLAGVTMNVLLAWVLLVGAFMIGMPTQVLDEEVATVENPRLLILDAAPETPASLAGLQASDEIVGLENQAGETVDQLTVGAVTGFISTHAEEELTFTIERGGETETVLVTPATNILPDDPDRAVVGINLALAGIVSLPVHEAIKEGSLMTWNLLSQITVGTILFIKDAFTFKADFDQVAGPVGIVGMVGDASSLGLAYLVTFTAFISLTLAVINLLPFPALDGGRLVFVLIEAITRRPIPHVIANNANRVGFVLLLLLMVAVTYNDIVKLL